ncbi:FecR family protein [Rhodopirellula sp.]|nr:FecR family protein [Rhodopirellula sp.]MDB4678911.1 FecR family protein [Rhodopirellula sp.]
MKDQNEFEVLWNNYLEGEISSEEMTQLQEHFACDEQLLQHSVDSFQIHRLLGYEAQADDDHEAFVTSTMAQLLNQPMATMIAQDPHNLSANSPLGKFQRSLTSHSRIAAIVIAASLLLALGYFINSHNAQSSIIAKTTNVHGTIEWTHENGVVETLTETNVSLTGGTLETMTSESTITMQFTDGTTVTLDGLSLLTISEQKQKILRLKRGNLSADVAPQPNSKPMMVFTEAAELRVVGTQFNVNAQGESTKLIVNEGEVLLKRTTDGESVNVVPQHQVVASLRDAKQLRSVKRARQAHVWKSDLQSETSHGKWIPSKMELVKELKLAVTNGKITQAEATRIYKKEASLSDQQGSTFALPSRFGLSVVVSVNQAATIPVVLEQGSRIRITGRAFAATNLVVGITTNQLDGGFSGKYQQKVDLSDLIDPATHEFTLDIPIKTMSRIVDHFPLSPIGNEFVSCWCSHPTNKVTKIELTDIEIVNAE